MPLRLHFLNVGHGDCTIIEHHSGRISMIDINNSKSLPETDRDALAHDLGISKAEFLQRGVAAAGFSWEDYYRSLLVDPAEYYLENLPQSGIFRYIQTHPDMDHMSGLHRFFVQEGIELQNMWDTSHSKTFTESDFDSYRFDYADWQTYQLLRSGTQPDGQDLKVLRNLQGESRDYWDQDGIEVLAPNSDLAAYANETENWNNHSYVLKVSHAGRSVILPGDAEKPVWDAIEAHGAAGVLECDVLKASHHGRESGYSESAVDAMAPSHVICSVGKKPSTDASNEYASHGAQVLSTRFHGTITVAIHDNGSLTITGRNGQEIGSQPARRAA